MKSLDDNKLPVTRKQKPTAKMPSSLAFILNFFLFFNPTITRKRASYNIITVIPGQAILDGGIHCESAAATVKRCRSVRRCRIPRHQQSLSRAHCRARGRSYRGRSNRSRRPVGTTTGHRSDDSELSRLSRDGHYRRIGRKLRTTPLVAYSFCVLRNND